VHFILALTQLRSVCIADASSVTVNHCPCWTDVLWVIDSRKRDVLCAMQ
jgi:hypothetical protein